MILDNKTEQLLKEYALKYETAEFIIGDPSYFMHQVSGTEEQEAMAFLAASISYGARSQFLPRIQWMLERSEGRPHEWVCGGRYLKDLPEGDSRCFYRLYNIDTYSRFLSSYRALLLKYGSLGDYLRPRAGTALEAIDLICRHFAALGTSEVIPKDTKSSCKRLAMFLRWMVRGGSPVDLGLWEDFIPRTSLIMPLDTHVLSEAARLGLVSSRNASMSSALKLTKALAEVFPEDPLKGDFALFGYGVNHS